LQKGGVICYTCNSSSVFGFESQSWFNPMVNEQQLRILVTPACEQFGVRELSLFGSRARGNARPESDYDFLVTFDRTKGGRLSDRFFGLLFFLEDHLANQIDLVDEEAIRNPYLREAIAHDKKLIYEPGNQKSSL
jgi:predicted nucleotidyltransferase